MAGEIVLGAAREIHKLPEGERNCLVLLLKNKEELHLHLDVLVTVTDLPMKLLPINRHHPRLVAVLA